jgi:hypothetical protein
MTLRYKMDYKIHRDCSRCYDEYRVEKWFVHSSAARYLKFDDVELYWPRTDEPYHDEENWMKFCEWEHSEWEKQRNQDED